MDGLVRYFPYGIGEKQIEEHIPKPSDSSLNFVQKTAHKRSVTHVVELLCISTPRSMSDNTFINDSSKYKSSQCKSFPNIKLTNITGFTLENVS